MYERILVGTDGSKTAAKAVDRAVQVAATVGASLKATGHERGTSNLAVAGAGVVVAAALLMWLLVRVAGRLTAGR